MRAAPSGFQRRYHGSDPARWPGLVQVVHAELDAAYTSSMGDIYEVELSVEGDLYVVNGVDKHSDSIDPPNSVNGFLV